MIANIYDARNFRLHKNRIAELDYSRISILDPHPIASRQEILNRERTSKVLYENALIINKFQEVNDGRHVSNLN